MALAFDDPQAAALLEVLGLPADTIDPDLVVATASDLAAQAAGVDPATPSTVAAAARKAGLELVDEATLSALRHDAAEGRRVAAAAAKAAVEHLVDDAISKGKITPARRTHWVNLVEADPGMADVLAATPPETAVPLTEIGHSAEPDDLAKRPAWFY